MDKESQLKNYIGLVNFLTFMRWIIIIIFGIGLTLVLGNSIEYLLLYSIAVFSVLLIIEILVTIGISIFKRKLRL
ncbi:MAG: hypothetical protein ACFFE5_04175 [Candidatus Thorarchaeota archaeon]